MLTFLAGVITGVVLTIAVICVAAWIYFEKWYERS